MEKEKVIYDIGPLVTESFPKKERRNCGEILNETKQEERGYLHTAPIGCSLAQFGSPGYSFQEILDELGFLNKSDSEDSTEEVHIWNLSPEAVHQIITPIDPDKQKNEEEDDLPELVHIDDDT